MYKEYIVIAILSFCRDSRQKVSLKRGRRVRVKVTAKERYNNRSTGPCLFSHTMFGLANFWDKLQPPRRLSRELTWGLIIGVTVSISSTSLALLAQEWRRKRAVSRIPPRPIEIRSEEVADGVIGLIGAERSFGLGDMLSVGNTPLIRINSLSNALGVEIMVRRCEDETDGRAKQRCVKNSTSLMVVSESGRVCERPCCSEKYAEIRLS